MDYTVANKDLTDTNRYLVEQKDAAYTALANLVAEGAPSDELERALHHARRLESMCAAVLFARGALNRAAASTTTNA